MPDVTAQCQQCRASLTLPMPDVWGLLVEQATVEEMVAADDQEHDAEMMWQFMHEIPCPSCGQRALRVTLPPDAL
jgi:hypothetical protein